MIYKQPCHNLDLCTYSLVRYSETCYTQIYTALYGDAMLIPFGGTSTCRLQSKKTSVITFNLPSKRKAITLEFRNIEINTCTC